MVRELITGIRSTLVLWVLTALIYPFLIIGIGQAFFPDQANGSLIRNAQGEVIGSALIGQPFSSERYFWSRPSTTNYSSFPTREYNPQEPDNLEQRTGGSGASNLAPSNTNVLLKPRFESPDDSDLLQLVQGRANRLKQATIEPIADLVYTSGSGLDPHISIEAARAQIQRIAQARGLDSNRVEILVNRYTEGRYLGILGEPGVNVLRLNLALEAVQTSI